MKSKQRQHESKLMERAYPYIFALIWAGGPIVFWLLVFYIFSKLTANIL